MQNMYLQKSRIQNKKFTKLESRNLYMAIFIYILYVLNIITKRPTEINWIKLDTN